MNRMQLSPGTFILRDLRVLRVKLLIINTRAPKVSACPCGSSMEYDACCGRWHAGEAAPTAESLMRSRYSGFVLKNESYLLASWHSSTRPSSIEFMAEQKWLGLKVVGASTDADRAQVEFIARFRIGVMSAQRLHERSRFVCEDGRWFYVDGDHIDR